MNFKLPKGRRLEDADDARTACFVIIAGPQAGQLHKIIKQESFIGRADEADICISEGGVSRNHAKVTRTPDGGVTLTDLGSTNGTFCNSEKVGSRVLRDGDRINIGTTTVLKFSWQDAVEERFQREQYERATRDGLTGCYNKKVFIERLPAELAFAQRHQKPLSLAMIDIDHFKAVNDTFGHQAGDKVLKHFATLLRQTIRVEDVLCRYGGEEFSLIMREASGEQAYAGAERIRKVIAGTPLVCAEYTIAITASIGLCTFPDDGEHSPAGLIRVSDEHLYRAKHAGRNRTAAALVLKK